MSNSACLLIADISGYTGYLAAVELDHAQDILADLMNTVVGSVKPSFRLAKLEGDAAFTYALGETFDGSELQDTVERCYFQFRRRLRDIEQASSCDCNACMLMPALNLKILVHHGQVAFQDMAGRKELVGSDVIVAHRLLKNTVDLPAYALYTEACIQAAAIDPAEGLVRHEEEYEHVGTVVGWVRDLETAWNDEQAKSRYLVDAAKAAVWMFELPGAPQQVWAQMTGPANRLRWQGIDGLVSVTGGRRGQGSVNHCQHGSDVIVEEILDWQPFDYYTHKFEMQRGAPKLTMSTLFTELPNGCTRIEERLEKPRGKKTQEFFEMVKTMFDGMVVEQAAALRSELEASDSEIGLEQAPDEAPPQSELRYLKPV